MDYLVSIILGVVQGITEFLPISSTGHLIIGEHLFSPVSELARDPEIRLEFLIALHVGTAIAILLYFIRDWIAFIGAFFRVIFRKPNGVFEEKLVFYLLLGCIPAGVIGILFEDMVEVAQNSILLVAIMLFVFSIVIFLADHLSKKTDEIQQMTWWKSLLIGTAQCIALLPGVSRSGITISAALAFNMKREAAARFSFLLSTPVVVGAALWALKDFSPAEGSGLTWIFAVGVLASFIVGILSIHFLLAFLKRFSMNLFVIYRIILSVILVLALLLDWI